MSQSNNKKKDIFWSEVNFHGSVTGPIHTGSGDINITSNQKDISSQTPNRDEENTAVTPQDLQQVLIEAFDLSELQNLAFSLNIDYEELSGRTKSDKIRELIKYCQRHGQYEELVDHVKKLRPGC